MIWRILLGSCSLIILLISDAIAASAWSNVHPTIVLGAGYTTVGNSRNIWLDTTPEPGLENNYASDGQQNDTLLLGLALDKTFATNLKSVESSIGVEMDYLRNNSLTGVVHPMVNVAPDFDTLKYFFRMKSYLLLANAKLNVLDILPSLGAYFQAGVGGAINQFSDYTEKSPTGSSAAPMLAPFRNDSYTRFAYTIGTGIICQVAKSARLLIGYRYINTGLGGFKTSPIQHTNDTLTFLPLSNHFLTFSLTV